MGNGGKLKIAMLGHKRIPGREGGVEVVVEELATRMAALGHSVTCYNRGGHHAAGKEFDVPRAKEYKGVRLKSVPTINGRGLAAMSASVTGALGAAFGAYDVVHFHAEGPALMCWLPKLAGKRVVVTIHGLDHRRAKWGKLASAYIMLGEKSAVRFADEIIVLSKDAQRYFQDRYGRDTVLIPNGVSRPRRRAACLIAERFGLKKGSYILYLGRLVPEKGVKYLIEAFKEVRTEKRLVIAGGNSDADEFFQELRQLAADDGRILFTGFVQGQMLEELYSNSYLYCLPSDLEGMPLGLLEAMSYGNCCLVSDISECTDLTGDRAVTFRRGDSAQLAQKLQMLCERPEMVEHYAGESADFICERYDWDKIVERTLRVYREKERYADFVGQ